MKLIHISKSQLECLVREGLSGPEIANRLGVKLSLIRKKLFVFKLKSKHKRSHSPEQRKNISLGRKRFLSENPDEHPWRKHSKFKSAPCEHLKKWLKGKQINFIEEYNPNVQDRHFSIDIFLPDKNIGIEVNGNQHYDRLGELKPYYLERHNLIQDAGIKLYQIHYTACYKLGELEKLFNSLA